MRSAANSEEPQGESESESTIDVKSYKHPSHKIKMEKEWKMRSRNILILTISLILVLMVYLFQNASFFLRSITTIVSLLLFLFADQYFKIQFEMKHYVFLITIIIASVLFSPLYFLYPNYDKIQHFILPILVSSIIFFMISKLKLDLKWKITFTFFITIGILGVFEIIEYGLDKLYDFKLQGVYLRDTSGLEKLNIIQEPLDDTMTDIAIGILGSALYSLTTWISRRKSIPNKK